MNRTTPFVAGLILGVLISSMIFNSSQKNDNQLAVTHIKDLEMHIQNSKEEQSRLKAEITEIKAKYAAGFEKDKSTELKEVKKTEKLEDSIEMFARIKQPVKSRKTVNLSYETILDLEKNWDFLPGQIQLTKEQRGWRVKSIQAYSTLSNAGLNQGDLITEKFVKEFSENSDFQSVGQMEKRVMNILNHVTVE